MTELDILKAKIIELEKLNSYYEQDGVAKLFYGLNRKAGEMADILNRTALKDLDLSDAKDKTFDRIKIIWNDASSIAVAVKALGEAAGVTNNEEKDIVISKFKRITTPESMADSIGQLAGKQNS